MIDAIRKLFDDSVSTARAAREHLAGPIAQAVKIIVDAYRAGGGIFLFGNGGSAADAQHVAGEMVGRFLAERRALKAEALSTNTSVLTGLANDYGYETVFARQLEANASAKDVAIGLSTSGDSLNVVAGLAKARQIGMKTIAMTGAGGGRCAEFADVLLDAPSEHTPRIQETHMIAYHAICELVEKAVTGDNLPRR